MAERSKRSRAAAAALVLAALVGCEERAPGPVGPDASIRLTATGGNPGSGGGGGGGGTTPLAEVTIAGAISTEGAAYPVEYFRDNKRALELGANTGVVTRLEFLATHEAGLAGCVTDQPTTEEHKQALLDLLVDPAQERVLWMTVDKTKLGQPASGQGVSQPAWSEDEGTLYSLGVNTSSLLPAAGSPTVTAETIDGSTTAYTFQGGVVNVKDRSDQGGALAHVHLVCPNLDVVTVTVRRL